MLPVISLRKYSIYLLPLLLFACSKPSSEHTASIPKESSWVGAFDIKAISEKGKLTESSEYNSLKRLKKEMDNQPEEMKELFESFMKDPLSLGVDLSKDVFTFYYNKSGEGGKKVGMLAAIGDRSTFKKNVEKILKGMDAPDEVKIEEKKGRSFLYVDGPVLAWDGTRLLVLGPLGPPKKDEEQKKELTKEAHRLFDLKNKNSLVKSNEDFQKFLKRRKDVSNWLAYGELMEEERMIERGMEELPEEYVKMLRNMNFHVYLAFKSNSIELEYFMNSSGSKKYEEILGMMKEGVDKELMNYLPKKSYMGMGYAFDPDAVYKMMKDMGEENAEFKEAQREMKKNVGVSLEKTMSSLSGDFLGTISDFGSYKRTFKDFVRNPEAKDPADRFKTVEKTKDQLYPKGSFLFKTRTPYIKKQLEQKVASLDSVESKGEYYKVNAPDIPPLYMGWTEDKVIFGSHEESVKKLFNGGYSSGSFADSEMGSSFASSPSSLYMVLDPKKYPSEVRDYFTQNMPGRAKKKAENALGVLDRFEMSVIEKNGVKATLKLKEGEGNSLYRLLKAADENRRMFMMAL